MTDSLPKIKAYITISIFQLMMNITALIFQENLTSIDGLLIGGTAISTSFIPFVSLVNLAFVDFPLIVLGIFAIFTVIFSAVQTLLIVMLALNIAPLTDG